MEDYNPIIFGKNDTEYITSYEVKDNEVTFWCETPDGLVVKKEPNLFWAMSSKSGPIKLNGNLHFKYAKTYDTESAWRKSISGLPRTSVLTAWNVKENSQMIKGFTCYKNMKPKDVSILSWDIETSGLVINETSKVYVISSVYRNKDKYVKKLFVHDEYESTKEMIEAWCAWVREMNPSILLAYNGNMYDIPYLKHVAQMNGTDLFLGRDGSAVTQATKPSKFRKEGGQFYSFNRPHCYGREVIDQLFVTIRYDIGRKMTSYALKTVAKEMNIMRDGRSIIDASDFITQLIWNRKGALEYALDDAEDTLKLFDKTIAVQFYSSQVIPRSLQQITETASGAQINSLIIREYIRQLHSVPKPQEAYPFEGGISVAIPGLYKNGVLFDLSNFYPSIIMQFRPYDERRDPLGVFYDTLTYFREERLKHKKLYAETHNEYHDGFQQAFKVIANSYYGFLGANGLNFNCISAAAKITEHARNTLSTAIKYFTSNEASDIIKLYGTAKNES